MRYIIAYRLKRKNARRRVYSKFDAVDEYSAIQSFEYYIKDRTERFKESPKTWELLTGDWKHVCYWCEQCKRVTNDKCMSCTTYLKTYIKLKWDGEKNEGLS